MESAGVPPDVRDSYSLGLGPERILLRCAGAPFPSASIFVPAADTALCAVIAVIAAKALSAMSTLVGRDDVLL